MKKYVFLFLAAAALLAVSPALAQSDDEALLRTWIQTLGSDEFGGRAPMTPYEETTVSYLAGQMAALGLQPAFGDSWYQEVQTVSTDSKPVGGKFRVKGKGRKTDLVYPAATYCPDAPVFPAPPTASTCRPPGSSSAASASTHPNTAGTISKVWMYRARLSSRWSMTPAFTIPVSSAAGT